MSELVEFIRKASDMELSAIVLNIIDAYYSKTISGGISMLIWSHADAGCLHIVLLYALFGIVPLIGLVLYFFKCFLPAVRDPDNRNWLARALLSIPIVLILVVEAFALRLPMTIVELHTAERHTLRGQVALVYYAEDWGRSFNGYTVVLSVTVRNSQAMTHSPRRSWTASPRADPWRSPM